MRSHTSISKFLSLVLRHQPEVIGLTLDRQGWADVEELLEKCRQHGRPLDLETLREVVANNDKKRFVFSENGRRIRASQGHSLDIDLGYEPAVPPDLLFHGTARRFLDAIRGVGLRRQSRQHVHLSPDKATAEAVGRRHGQPVILVVDSAAMHAAGHKFFLSENGVWLTEAVPADYLAFPE